MSDTEERRAGAVILKDLALFNKAAVLFEDTIGPEVFTEVSEFVSKWQEKHRWEGHSKASDYADIAVWPGDWRENSEEPYAKFHFARRAGSQSDSYDLADLCGVGQTNSGFKFEANYSWFGGKAGWNKLVRTFSELSDELVKKGWVNEGKGVFFRPVTLPQALLAAAWETEDWNEAFAPLELTLNALWADQAIFGKIIMRAKSSSG